jgi:hypothetical protein
LDIAGKMMSKQRLVLIGCTTTLMLTLGGMAIAAQDAGGLTQCLVGCAKSDKPCQDRCIPSPAIGARAHACLASCRRDAKDPDLVPRLRACVARCLQGTEAGE